jgi:hypothetical protein
MMGAHVSSAFESLGAGVPTEIETEIEAALSRKLRPTIPENCSMSGQFSPKGV